MKKLQFGVVALACFTAASLSAQTTPPSSSPQTPTASAAQGSSDSKTVTVSGCLERAKESSASASAGTSGTAGTAGASASSSKEKFVLNMASSASPSTAATGTSGSASASASSYRLDGEDAELTPHVGHKVEITGTVDKSASATGASMSASSPKLKVDSIKMIASTCTP